MPPPHGQPLWTSAGRCQCPLPSSLSLGPAAELLTAYLISASEPLGPNEDCLAFLPAGTRELPSHPQTSFCFFPSALSWPLLRRAKGAGARHRHGGRERCAQEGGGLERGREPPQTGREGKAEQFPTRLAEASGSSLRPHLGQSVLPFKPQSAEDAGPGLTPLTPQPPSRSPQPHYTLQAPSPTPCPQPCPSGKLRDICCVTEAGLFPGQARRVGWGGSIGAGGGKG